MNQSLLRSSNYHIYSETLKAPHLYDAALIRIIYSKGEFSGALVSGSKKSLLIFGDDIPCSYLRLFVDVSPPARDEEVTYS